ncbi:MAG: PSD1 domain-containing protein [Bryobacterales bacterium]|nr:PSD1 domain-containing protein [Bryobacterales bacterium]
MRPFLSFLLTLGIAVPALAAVPAPEDIEFFEKQVRPLLAENCFSCHSGAAKVAFAGLRLDTREGALKGSDAGPVVVPGRSAESLLVKAVRGEMPKRMPPGRKLTETQIAALASWIDRGVPWPAEAPSTSNATLAFDLRKRRREHWAWQPVQPVSLPALQNNVQNKAWPLQPVDYFILARLEQRGLTPAKPAGRTAWLRRVTFDLTGLPPTPAEIQSFTADQSSNAYDKVVDRLLESPRFGERWARRWMDLMRYTESHGSEGDPAIPFAWRYRDYLVRAFNADVPYDQLIREHLAGDLLPNPRTNPTERLNESILALAQFRMVEHGFQPVDPWEDRVKWTDNQIDVFSKTFQALTVSCARCHDHKFDAISQRDYYALLGIFASARPTQIPTDEPAVLNKNRAELAQSKLAIKAELAKAWDKLADTAAAQLLQDNPWFTVRTESFRLDLTAAAHFYSNELPARRAFNAQHFPHSFNPSDPGWVIHGLNTTSTPGEIAIEPQGARVITGVLPQGVYTHLLTPRHSGIITSPRFKIDTDYISMKVSGANGAAVRLIVENYAVPRGGIYNQITPLNDSKPHWIRWNTNFWKGFTAYIEFATADMLTVPPGKDAKEGRSWIGVQQILFHNTELTPKDDLPAVAALLPADPPASPQAYQTHIAATLRQAVQAWRDNRATATQAALLDHLIRQNLLPVSLDALPDVRPLLDRYRKLEQDVPLPRHAPGILEESGDDQPLLIRGAVSRRGAPVPRRYLEALNSRPYADRRSMRLQLANEVASPDNPLTARVMANRVWYTLFRRGIVRTVDNFGKLGDKPSHPELLDYLAARFVADGWSIKKLTRMLALSQTYRLSGGDAEPEPLWQHMPMRRLEAEELRDTMLAVSGQLDTKMYGASVPVYYSHETGKTKDDRPKGPLNGNGRRSVYLEIRRNATDPLLEVFDVPKPSTTRGVRDVTNVPAQSLALMNSPFVIEQAGRWAQQNEEAETMFLRAVGRPATPAEADDMKSYLAATSRRDLAHALFNLKEFLYVR